MNTIKRTSLLLLILMIISSSDMYSQNNIPELMPTQEIEQKGKMVLSAKEMRDLANLKEFVPPANFMHHKTTLPGIWDNEDEIYFRPLFNDVALECGQASGVSLGFVYELNYMRGTDASLPENQIPSHFVYNFQNNGQSMGVSYFDSWEVLKELGSPSVTQYGGMHIGNSTSRERYWATGYNTYYQGMHNRAHEIYMLKVNTPEGLETLKYWMYNHADGSPVGGIANFYSTYMGIGNLNQLPVGTPNAGKYVVTHWGGSNHGMTITGWNDSIRYDFNNDGIYTNDVDINSDGVIDMKDWEIGGLRFANTYANPGGYSWANGGTAFMMYATLAKAYGSGGIWNNSVHIFTAKENVEPLLTFKFKITHTDRSSIRIRAGVATDTAATVPEHEISFNTFNGKGGNYGMQGLTPAIEMGLDVSELLNYVNPGDEAKYFLVIEEASPATGEGTINYFSVIDYTSGISETNCSETNVTIAHFDITQMAVKAVVNYSDVSIVSSILSPAEVGTPYQEPLLATGGTTPYFWELMHDYDVNISNEPFPTTSAQSITTSHYDYGFAGHALDFEFPFYGERFDSVVIFNDGYLLFAYEDFTWRYARSKSLLFKLHKMIAPYMADINYSLSSGDGIWYEGDANSATFRWKGYLDGQGSSDFNFAVSLFPNGAIDFYYGAIDYSNDHEWYGGITDGDHRNYIMHEYSNQSVPPNTRISFTPRVYPPEIKVTTDGYIVGTLTDTVAPVELKVRATDNNGLFTEKLLLFFSNGFSGIVQDAVSVFSGTDNIVENAELAVISLDLMNLDSVAVTNGTVTVSSTNAYVTMLDDTENFALAPPNTVISLSDAFTFNVSMDVPNVHDIVFHALVEADNDTSEFEFLFTAYAPTIEKISSEIDDGANGILDPGETADLLISFANNGGTEANNLSGFISTNDPYVSLISIQDNIDTLAVQDMKELSYQLAVHANTPIGHVAHLNLDLIADDLSPAFFDVEVAIGSMVEGWETIGGFFDWQSGGDTAWFQTSLEFYEDTSCLQSGDIDDYGETSFSLELDVIANGFISFARKVSCEYHSLTNYDYLVFYIDGVEQQRWDSLRDWEEFEYPVVAGLHTFQWMYHKDLSVSSFSDCAWIDKIVLPPNNLIYGPPAVALSANDYELCAGQSTHLFSFVDGVFDGPITYSWSPGLGLSDSTIAEPLASPELSTEYSLIVSDGTNSADTSIYITVFPVPDVPVIMINADTLISSAPTGNQWFNAQGPILGAIYSEYVPTSSGDFYVIAMDANGCVSEPSDVLHFVPLENNLIKREQISLYPNPFTDKITFEIGGLESKLILEIFSIDGKLQQRFEVHHTVGGMYQVEWDGKNLSGEQVPPGSYQYRLYGDVQLLSGRFVKL